MNSESSPLDRLELISTSIRGLKIPGHVLRREAAPLDFDSIGADICSQLAHQLLAATHRGRGIGLAAPMVGLSLRAIVATDEEQAFVMFNPEVTARSEETTSSREGNLCLPGVSAVVERPAEISIAWQDAEGASHERAFEGPLARTLQHEMELLDGRIFTDVADKETTTHLSPGARAEAATAFVFNKPPPTSDDPPRLGRQACVTLPPAFGALTHSTLRRPAEEVRPEHFKRNQLRELIEAMFRLQYELSGVGLAAPQMGYGLRLAVIDSYEEKPLVLLNPKVMERGDAEETLPERCLSIPGWEGPVPRATEVTLRNHSLDGKAYEVKFSGRLARIVQHEYDHLDGVLYPERVRAGESLVRTDPEALAAEALSSPAPS